MSQAELYNKAADLVESSWTQLAGARNVGGYIVHPCAKDAESWCLSGALSAAVYIVEGYQDHQSTFLGLLKNLGLLESPTNWNDNSCRKKKEVVALLRKAAARSQSPKGECYGT